MGALVLTVLASVWGGIGQSLGMILWVALAAVALADIALSIRRTSALNYRLPSEVFVGETLTLHLSDDHMRPGQRVRFYWPDGLSGPSELAFADDGSVAAEVTAVRRGRWELEHAWLCWPSWLLLFEFVPKVRLAAEVRVVPNIRAVRSGSITTQVVSALFGTKENRSIGDGSEFHQLRDFVAGMDVKTIDWKRSARRRALLAKETRAERNHHVVLAIDTGYLMREEISGLPKLDHALTAALSVAWAAAIGGDLVAHYAYDVKPRAYAKPEPGRTAFVRLRSWAAELDYTRSETNHTLALIELSARTPKRSLIIIFTDFVDTTSAELMLENIGILAKRHLILFVAMRDPDIEDSREATELDMIGVSTLVAANQTIAERRLVLERLTRLGVTVIDAKPGQITGELISKYLEIKARELI